MAAIRGFRALSINVMAALSCASAAKVPPVKNAAASKICFTLIFFIIFYILTKLPDAANLPSLCSSTLYVPGATFVKSISKGEVNDMAEEAE